MLYSALASPTYNQTKKRDTERKKKKKSEKVYLCFSPERLSVLVYLGMCAQAFKSYYREINWKYKNTVYTCTMSQIVKKKQKKNTDSV